MMTTMRISRKLSAFPLPSIPQQGSQLKTRAGITGAGDLRHGWRARGPAARRHRWEQGSAHLLPRSDEIVITVISLADSAYSCTEEEEPAKKQKTDGVGMGGGMGGGPPPPPAAYPGMGGNYGMGPPPNMMGGPPQYMQQQQHFHQAG